jgi:hypothetical protein
VRSQCQRWKPLNQIGRRGRISSESGESARIVRLSNGIKLETCSVTSICGFRGGGDVESMGCGVNVGRRRQQQRIYEAGAKTLRKT